MVNSSGCDITPKNLSHVAAWAVPERGLTVSSLFAIPGQQPLNNNFRRHDFSDPVLIERDDRFEIGDHLPGTLFQYFWFCNQREKKLVPPKKWKLLNQYKFVTLWPIAERSNEGEAGEWALPSPVAETAKRFLSLDISY